MVIAAAMKKSVKIQMFFLQRKWVRVLMQIKLQIFLPKLRKFVKAKSLI